MIDIQYRGESFVGQYRSSVMAWEDGPRASHNLELVETCSGVTPLFPAPPFRLRQHWGGSVTRPLGWLHVSMGEPTTDLMGSWGRLLRLKGFE